VRCHDHVEIPTDVPAREYALVPVVTERQYRLEQWDPEQVYGSYVQMTKALCCTFP